MKKQERLLPCPFCGIEGVFVSRDWPDSAPQVMCGCGARGPSGIKSEKTAIDRWNRRAK
jgi:Lar family restriction alleviation protein